MKMLFKLLPGYILFSFLFSACNQQKPVPLNPNGDSELAILMRAMYEDGLKMKNQVKYGGIPRPSIDHSKMLTAEATEPEKVATDEYLGFTDSYLKVIESFKAADREQAMEVYVSMVDQCKSCHQSMCPGPIVKIDKLYLDTPMTELR